MSDDLIRQDAVTIVGRLKKGEVTPHDLLDAVEKRIAAVNGPVNALPTLCFDRARAHADRLLTMPMAERGQLAGMPVPIKDLVDVAGVVSTQGSPIEPKPGSNQNSAPPRCRSRRNQSSKPGAMTISVKMSLT